MTHPHTSILDDSPTKYVRDYSNLSGAPPQTGTAAKEISWVSVVDADDATHWQEIAYDENTGAQTVTYYDMPGGNVTTPTAPVTVAETGGGSAAYVLVSTDRITVSNTATALTIPAGACGAELYIYDGGAINFSFDTSPTTGPGGGVIESRRLAVGCTPTNNGTAEELQQLQIVAYSADSLIEVLYFSEQ